MEDEEEDEEEDEMDGSDEDECGVAVSITSPEEEGDPEGNKNSMSPCLQRRNTKQTEESEKARFQVQLRLDAADTYLILSRLRVLFWERISPVLLRFR